MPLPNSTQGDPATGGMNTFQPAASPFAPLPVPAGVRHVSHESVDLAGGGMMNGRHSPDAFAGLSARIMR
jgi:hypothetical protein